MPYTTRLTGTGGTNLPLASDVLTALAVEDGFDRAAGTSLDLQEPPIPGLGAWDVRNGTIEHDGSGAVVASGADPGGEKWVAIYEHGFSDGRVGARVRSTDSLATPVGPLARYADADNHLFASLRLGIGVQLWGRSGGTNVALASNGDVTITEDVWYDLALHLDGDQVSVYLDGVRVIAPQTVAAGTSETAHGLRLGGTGVEVDRYYAYE